MKSENQKGESESDWDSMSEMQQGPTSDSIKSKTEANTSFGGPSREEEDIPPYRFKHDRETHSIQAPAERPPGKTQKGCLYDPTPSQEELTGNLPRKLKPLPVVTHIDEMERKNMKHISVYDQKNHSSMTNFSETLQNDLLKGIHNSKLIHDYEKKESDIDEEDEDEEEDEIADGSEESGRKSSGRWKRNFDALRNKRHLRNSNKNYNSDANSNSGSSIRKVRSEYPFKDNLKLIDSLVQKAFHTFAFPFACFFILLHHCIKFLLVDILHPMLIETLVLFLKYFIEPFCTKVLRPILRTLFLAFEILSSILAKFLYPFIEVVRAFRLVEINVNKKQDTLCV